MLVLCDDLILCKNSLTLVKSISFPFACCFSSIIMEGMCFCRGQRSVNRVMLF